MKTLKEILSEVRKGFISNFAMQEAYGFTPKATWEDTFSDASIESVFTYTTAMSIYQYAAEIDAIKTELLAALQREQPYTIEWYHKKILEFQYGDIVEYDPQTRRFGYAVLDVDKRPVKYCAVRQVKNENELTVIKIYATGENKAALDPLQINALQAYIRLTGAAGTHFAPIISKNPDVINMDVVLYYDPQRLTAAGLELSTGAAVVKNTIDSYLSGIEYTGKFNLSKCEDAIQSVAGVKSVRIDKINAGTPAQQMESVSGFFKLNVLNIEGMAYYD